MRFYYRDEGGLRTLTSRGQTLHWIWTVSYRLPEGFVGYMLTANEEPTLKTVGPSVFTDRQTDRHADRQTDTQTDRHDRQTDRHTDIHTDIQTDIQTDRDRQRQTERQPDRQTDRERDRQ